MRQDWIECTLDKLIDYTGLFKDGDWVVVKIDSYPDSMRGFQGQVELILGDIQDAENDNTTVFIVVAKDGIDPDLAEGTVLTTMLFTIRNITGSLYKALGGFATNNVNMVKLESYIPGGMSKQAKFFITIEGHPSQQNVALALEELGFFSRGVKLIGVYHADKARLAS